MKRFFTWASCLALAFLTVQCSDDDDDDNPTTSVNETLRQQVIISYTGLVYANYSDALQDAKDLQTALVDFADNPSQSTHDAAKAAWLNSRESYGQTEAFRFGEGPIDDADGPEGLLNAWPLDESFVDYVEGTGGATSGIINDPTTYPNLDKDLLESLNEQGGEENVAIGYHAIEFLLWGQDLNPNGDYSTSGQRPYTDYVEGTNGTADNQGRRATYLKLCAELLVGHLQDMVDEWSPTGSNNYRSTFVNLPSDEALGRILKGIAILSKGELAGERIFVAYNNQDQEDEHSCFSDNTHRDIVTNALGIRNVYLCQYQDLGYSGYSLRDYMETINSTVNQEIVNLMNQSVTEAEAVYDPFDEALVLPSERPKLLELVTTLQQQGDKIVEGATALGITISADLPE